MIWRFPNTVHRSVTLAIHFAHGFSGLSPACRRFNGVFQRHVIFLTTPRQLHVLRLWPSCSDLVGYDTLRHYAQGRFSRPHIDPPPLRHSYYKMNDRNILNNCNVAATANFISAMRQPICDPKFLG